MKNFSYYLLFTVLFFSVKSEASNLKLVNFVQKDTTCFYVIATSGLNYREKPKGKLLGKFPLNTKVELVKRTGVYQEIKDKGETKSGEWVGVKKEESIVYVFDAFLAKEKYEVPFNIYEVQGYNRASKVIGFAVLTDNYPWSDDYSFRVMDTEVAEKNLPHTLNSKYRARFLKGLKIKETDNVYIYNYSSDTLVEFKVRELPLLAEPNAYGDSSSQEDYLIGFDLKNKLDINKIKKFYNSFVYIGDANPFLKNKLVPIIWNEIPITDFPKVGAIRNKEYYRKNTIDVLNNNSPKNTFIFNNEGYTYYLGLYNEYIRYLMVFKKGKKVYDCVLYDGESRSFAPMVKTVDKEKDYHQFTGKMFKDKPPVMFGFMYISFGCGGIHILDEKIKRSSNFM